MTSYDIIGDIHGRADELEELLDTLGYECVDGVYQHPEGRQAIFLGDFINKGPHSKRVIDVVRPMVESGHAQAILGNHELSAIAFSSKDENGEYILPHSENVVRRNSGFLDDYPFGSDEYEDVIEWFKTLPVYIDLPEFRVIHACWDDEAVATLDEYLEEDNTLGEKAMQAYAERDRDFLHALKQVIIGPMHRLDDDMMFEDFHGVTSNYARLFWWASPDDNVTEQMDLQGRPLDPDWEKKLEMREKLKFDFMQSAKPTFIGHYYLEGPARHLSNDVTGLDFRDQLTAYRWNGPQSGASHEFVEISAQPL